MFEETVTSPSGVVKRVVGSDKAEVAEAVKAVKNEATPVTIDINVPVRKGHDLVSLADGGVTVGLEDGTGVHNSPRDAVRDDGSMEGNSDSPFLVPKREVATAQPVQEVVSDGELKDFDVEENAEPVAPQIAPEAKDAKKSK